MATSSSEPPPQSVTDCFHKTKLIQFLGSTAPIVLQNDSNVLSLRNNLSLRADTTEVSREKLLSLVAERLIDSNSNTDNKDAGYAENQQQNIADAIDLLPRLATGIDVNVKFTRISDFEFTPECAIFDLLDIPLYHGWIFDPQDTDTANAIGSKSYNSLTGELVALETQSMESECKNNNVPQDDCVDFAAATTATLGVPSPILSKTASFGESPYSASDDPKKRKEDREEEQQDNMALQMSEAEVPVSVGDPFAASVDAPPLLVGSDENNHLEKVIPVGSVDKPEECDTECSNSNHSELHVLDNTASRNELSDLISFETTPGETACSSQLEATEVENNDLPASVKYDVLDNLATERTGNESDLINAAVSTCPHSPHETVGENHTDVSEGGEKIEEQVDLASNSEVPGTSASNVGSDSSSGRMLGIDESGGLTSSGEGSEPIYEGEEHILESSTTVFEGEPVYEGEAVLAKLADKGTPDARSKDEITPQQDGLKERELCVFFRNNHFSTMFKVNGDTLFMTGDFKEFIVENQSTENWDENNAVTNTAGYLASIDSASSAGFDVNSDLQLAMALQQQEFEQQPQQQHQRPNMQQPSISGNSRMVTGPQSPSLYVHHLASALQPPSMAVFSNQGGGSVGR